MTDCGVCLSDNDYDGPTLYNDRFVRARIPHKCCECRRTIIPGFQYQKVTGKWEGYFNEHHTCMDCWNIREAFRCGGGFIFGQLWETLADYRNDINTGCLEKIKTPSAKGYYLERLRKMRGIDL